VGVVICETDTPSDTYIYKRKGNRFGEAISEWPGGRSVVHPQSSTPTLPQISNVKTKIFS
jgi:hypothetical protein